MKEISFRSLDYAIYRICILEFIPEIISRRDLQKFETLNREESLGCLYLESGISGVGEYLRSRIEPYVPQPEKFPSLLDTGGNFFERYEKVYPHMKFQDGTLINTLTLDRKSCNGRMDLKIVTELGIRLIPVETVEPDLDFQRRFPDCDPDLLRVAKFGTGIVGYESPNWKILEVYGQRLIEFCLADLAYSLDIKNGNSYFLSLRDRIPREKDSLFGGLYYQYRLTRIPEIQSWVLEVFWDRIKFFMDRLCEDQLKILYRKRYPQTQDFYLEPAYSNVQALGVRNKDGSKKTLMLDPNPDWVKALKLSLM